MVCVFTDVINGILKLCLDSLLYIHVLQKPISVFSQQYCETGSLYQSPYERIYIVNIKQ